MSGDTQRLGCRGNSAGRCGAVRVVVETKEQVRVIVCHGVARGHRGLWPVAIRWFCGLASTFQLVQMSRHVRSLGRVVLCGKNEGVNNKQDRARPGQKTAGSTALMRTESPPALSLSEVTAQHRSPVSPLGTATPSRLPFILTVSVPASESSSRQSTSPTS
jgi:hypothetical protein